MKASAEMLERFDARFFDGRLADRMQNRPARRAAAILYVLLLIVLGSLMGWVVWLLMSPADGGMALIFPANGNLALVFLSLMVGIIAPVIERVLVMAIRSAVPLAGEPFDERQRQACVSRGVLHPRIQNSVAVRERDKTRIVYRRHVEFHR